ncbi:hypothetical protein [Cyclobacterium qasimii]|uniref:Uncharacterized protein n=2 Tax=Cyclobacterium qasimii TaxID=1350429 RepID=S7VBU4_9BACT|nr:hypothetical protein [Cyclobacterium qasimii]EPR67042.1 hypothetical protein ADICYQ_3912 [Cyclobacterium qasimii M12-11B]GEO19739.1 hypothetical protein CQA01_02730 [Cyclobacterium qasimii]
MEVHRKEIAEKHFLWPIPTAEIDLNDAIDERVSRTLDIEYYFRSIIPIKK